MKSKLMFLGNNDSVEKRKGPKGFVAGNGMHTSACGAAGVTKGTGVTVWKEGGYDAVVVVSGVCAAATRALCPVTESALQQKSCKWIKLGEKPEMIKGLESLLCNKADEELSPLA